jgi:hypothetical protein
VLARQKARWTKAGSIEREHVLGAVRHVQVNAVIVLVPEERGEGAVRVRSDAIEFRHTLSLESVVCGPFARSANDRDLLNNSARIATLRYGS